MRGNRRSQVKREWHAIALTPALSLSQREREHEGSSLADFVGQAHREVVVGQRLAGVRRGVVLHTQSSSLVAVACLPRPPRFCARYSPKGWLLM